MPAALPPMHLWVRPSSGPPAVRYEDHVDAAVERALGGVAVQGKTVAVGAGSRALPDHATLVRLVVAAVRARGGIPTIVPAMGSHGGTPAGQRAILGGMGITEDACGAPIDDAMDVVELGTAETGMHVCWSKAALARDLTLLVNRVAVHPNLTSRLQSGLCKMSVLGLGKLEGARRMHAGVVSNHLEAAAALVRAKSNFVGGVALTCGFDGEPVALTGVPQSALPSAELTLLDRDKTLRPRLPFDAVDVVILDWLGKDVSPTGIDRKLLGRHEVGDPVRVGGVVALGITPASRGNGLGVGFADAITEHVVASIDPVQLEANLKGSGDVEACTIRRVFATDADAVRWAIETHGDRVLRLESTARLGRILASASLGAPAGYVDGGPAPWILDAR